MTPDDNRFLEEAFRLAKQSYENEGGIPIGAVLVRDNKIIGRGYNKRVQEENPILHGEMACLANARLQRSYKDTTLYTTLSPCMMCTGTIIQFRIPRVIIGENENFGGNEEFLRNHSVEIIIANHPGCIELMERFIRMHNDIWRGDIGQE